jgi:transporter family-2 protein
MTVSLILDHFGLIGYASHALNAWRIFGVVLIVGGVALIRWF